MNVRFLVIFILLSCFAFASVTTAAVVEPKQVYTYAKMERDIERLANTYPDLVRYEVIGKSEYGRNIYAISLGKGNSTIFVNGSHHAREWLTTNLNLYMLEQYAQAYRSNRSYDGGRYPLRSILNNTTIWFVPMINPDGVELQQNGLSSFPAKDHAALIAMNNGSRDFKRWKANGKGVDLNRQYDANWSTIRNNTGKPSFANYKGPSPHSSSETKAIVDFTKRIDPEMAVNYHSSGEILFWNFLQSGSQFQRDLSYATQIGRMTGYRLIPGGSNPSGGGMTDWFIQDYKRPAFTPELGRYVGATNLPLSAFDRAWKQNRYVPLYVAKEGHKLYLNRLRDVAQREVAKAEDIASKLTTYYIVPTPADVKLSPEFEETYLDANLAISKAASTVRQLNSGSLKRHLTERIERTVELRRRATVMIRAINRGELLLTRYDDLVVALKEGEVTDEVTAAYEQMLVEVTRTEDAIERIIGVGNRRIVTQAYVELPKATEQSLLLVFKRNELLKELEAKLEEELIEEVGGLFEQLAAFHIEPVEPIKALVLQLEEKELELEEAYINLIDNRVLQYEEEDLAQF
ncbi:M14 family zinc carboxypeptidase [Bacillus solitudinis]|uniref:M14 family zinc carboxypeptidase n=1 Tax=Bacillus solitudinis TaxID=2014074 RepID=UPI000C24BFA5|nr:M14 family zinc carboxypeptidase [Bacillus solitudinis]